MPSSLSSLAELSQLMTLLAWRNTVPICLTWSPLSSRSSWLMEDEFMKDLSNAWSFAEYAERKQLPRSSVNWKALWRLVECPYFSRVWIVQELAVRNKAQRDRDVVVCGLAVRDLEAMDAHADFNAAVGENSQLLGLAMFGFCDVDPSNRDKSGIEALIQLSSKFEATDPRDNIYAMLALACEEHRCFRPNYTKTLGLVLQELVEFAVRTSRNLHIILGNRREINPSAPSWAPDLRPISHGTPSTNFLPRFEHFQPDVGRPMDVEFDHSSGIMRPEASRLAESREPWSRELSQLVDQHGKDAVARTATADMGSSGGKVRCPAPDSFADRLGVYLDMQEPPGDGMGLAEETEQYQKRVAFTAPFVTSAVVTSFNHCLFTTECGRLGLGPYSMRAGDEVAVLFGSPFCLVLRPVEGSDSY
ncbi:hypothetical protein B0T22DRAFT_518734 [Podospora appendiculata]|uniref:Heterokaryon incompatibility domain-containing protein n=1 Tax=Podospora appendiculata TaxID=314037 RepID=A0AAE0X7E5_9PEZI|nr:hypothetical protein B0T22DRAFT_518734 [Podospora appendiculata]